MTLDLAKASVEDYIKNYMSENSNEVLDVKKLSESMEYSLFNGGKRFRPLLCCAVGEALDLPIEQVIPFATAIEFIHTYSLIHDDLP
ncbi:MAG: polyprenyl synthetase family protein, partial [Bdellovibrionales bacterium]|nr:polyprenyl synthetase family protein [Bdellovibrionales bacterium]